MMEPAGAQPQPGTAGAANGARAVEPEALASGPSSGSGAWILGQRAISRSGSIAAL